MFRYRTVLCLLHVHAELTGHYQIFSVKTVNKNCTFDFWHKFYKNNIFIWKTHWQWYPHILLVLFIHLKKHVNDSKHTTASGASMLSWFPASLLPEPFSLSFLRFFFSFSFLTDAEPLSLLSVNWGKKSYVIMNLTIGVHFIVNPVICTSYQAGFWEWTCRVCVWCLACRGIHRPYRNCRLFVS